ncbi:DNA internalization-related competence protein ComEC/Rec2 [bacterium]|nr:DNA internalization-related competence protein ComEC/Rec2 [bacterium]
MERDLPRPTLLAVLVLILGRVLAWSVGFTGWGVAVVLLVAAIGVGLSKRRSGHARAVSLFLGFLSVGVATQAGLQSFEFHDRAAVASLPEAPFVEVSGTVDGHPRVGSETLLLWLQPGAELSADGSEAFLSTPLPVQFRTDNNAPRVETGDHLQALGRVVPVDGDGNHLSWDRWLDAQGAVLLVRASTLQSTPPADPSFWLRYRRAMGRLSDSTEELLNENLSTNSASLLSAIMLARTGGLSEQQRHDFQRAGLMHLFAVSGLHAGLIAGLIVLVAAMLGLGPRSRAIVVLVGLLVFCTLTGFRSSVLRASLLVGVFVLQPLVRREVEPLSALSSVALVLLVFRPRALWQLDFQLSFLCALTLVLASPGVIAIQEHLGPKLGWKLPARIAIRWLQLAFVSACLQLALAPIVAGPFGMVSLIAPIANALILPFAAPILGVGFLGALLHPIAPEMAAGLVGLLDWPVAGLSMATTLFARVPGGAIEGLAPWPAWAIGIYYLILLSGRWMRLRRHFSPVDGAWSVGLTAIFALVFLIWFPLLQPIDRTARVTFLDVGQGDAVLVETGDGVTMLVDAGPERGQSLVRELRAIGVDHLDTLVLTHADADHVAGAPALMDAFPVGRLVVGGSLATTKSWVSVAESVDRHRIPVVQVSRGDVLHLSSGIQADVLHPTAEFLDEGDERNAASVVLRVSVGETSFLLTGDADFDSESDMLAHLPEANLRSVVLKAGHHGSASSTSMPFLGTVRPAHAVISCGRNNRYGHPAPEALARLQEMGVRIWRTDRQGTLSFESDGEHLWVRVERLTDAEPLIASWSK